MKPSMLEPAFPGHIDTIRNDVPQVTFAGGAQDLFAGAARESLDRALPRFLQSQRWFGAKARPVRAVRIADWAALQTNPHSVFLAFVEVAFEDGTANFYSLPLAAVTGPDATALADSLGSHLLARLHGSAGAGLLVDGLAHEPACQAILSAIATGGHFATRTGLIRATSTAAFADLRGSDDKALPFAPGPETSSNSLVLFGRRFLLKVLRRLENGISPELEIGRFLTEKTSFHAIPRTAGFMTWHRRETEPVTLAILQELVLNEGDGWKHALHELGDFFERVAGRHLGLDNDPRHIELMIGNYLQEAAILGKRTAELHLALASDNQSPAFSPEPVTAADLSLWAAEACDQARRGLTLLRENLDSLPTRLRLNASCVLDEGPNLLNRLAHLRGARISAAKIRCHGDYHLGQVLRAEGDYVVLDFEGEPARILQQRRAKQSPLKDVAGMLRSFSYAAYAGLFAFTKEQPGETDTLEPWADLWQTWISSSFLKEYRTTARAAVFVPAQSNEFSTLLQFFTLEKAWYELIYELNNRPDWVRIPLQGILSLAHDPVRRDEAVGF